MPYRLVLIGCEPVLHDLLTERLRDSFEIVGTARTGSEALQIVRSAAADVVLLDADLPTGDPADLIAKLALVGAAPLVALSAHAAPGAPAGAALLMAGARAIVAKTAGPLMLDLEEEMGTTLVAALNSAASA
jgi:two-component system chemotaxis response regulator CheB